MSGIPLCVVTPIEPKRAFLMDLSRGSNLALPLSLAKTVFKAKHQLCDSSLLHCEADPLWLCKQAPVP